MPQVFAVLSAVATVAGTVQNVREQRKASRLSQRQQEVIARRERRQTQRAAQIQRAQAVATAAGTGSLESSSAAGGIGSISSQVGEQIGFANQVSGLSRQINSAQASAQRGSGLAKLGGLGMQVFPLNFQMGGEKSQDKLIRPRARPFGNNVSGWKP